MLGTCCPYSDEAPLALFLRSNEDIKPYMDSIIILFYCVGILWGTQSPRGAGRHYHLNWGGERRRHVKAAWYRRIISSRALLWRGNNSCLPTGPLLCRWCQRKSAAKQGCTIASVVPARALGSVTLGQQAGLSVARGYQYTLARQHEPGHAAPGCYYFAVSTGELIHAETHPPLLPSPPCRINSRVPGPMRCVAVQAVVWVLCGAQARGGWDGLYHSFIIF